MQISHRKATESDLDLYFNWTNDEETRKNSFNNQSTDYQSHTNWFLNKISDEKTLMLVFENEEKIPVGQIRFEKKTSENIIGISIDKHFRGKGLAVPMLKIASEQFFNEFQENNIHAYIKVTNLASFNSFKKAGFEEEKTLFVNEEMSYLLVKNKQN